MICKEAIVNSNLGLHARPATLLVKKASRFRAQVEIEYNGMKADAKSLIGVLSLGVNKGSKIKILVSGYNEQAVMEEIYKTIEELP